MKLDEKLVSLRKEKGITQLKVAEELDIMRLNREQRLSL